jgi:hypothetical protein
MYAQDQAAIAARIHAHAFASPAWDRAAASAYAMVAMTILNQTPGVLSHCESAMAQGDSAPTWRFPTRRDALRAVRSGATVPVLRRVHALMQVGAVEQAHVTACELPWLDYAKAAFYLQAVYGVLGCFDSRNEAEFGVNVQAVCGKCDHAPRKTQAARDARDARNLAGAYAYSALCAAHGTCESLWDGWCAGVSAQWPHRFASADTCSAEHVRWYDAMHCALWRDAADMAAYQRAYPVPASVIVRDAQCASAKAQRAAKRAARLAA